MMNGIAAPALLSLLALFCGAAGCESEMQTHTERTQQHPQGGRKLTLHVHKRFFSKEQRVELSLVGEPGEVPPRMAEIFLSYAGPLRYVRAESGEAVGAADKQIIVRHSGKGLLRTVVFSASNLRTLSPGPLVSYVFEQEGRGEATVKLEPERTVLAPAGANAGLRLADPVSVVLD